VSKLTLVVHIAVGTSALVFAAAALGKLDSWGEWTALTDEFGLPRPWRRPVQFGVPLAETAIVVTSILAPTAGLAAAAALLALFAAAVWVLRGRLAGRECNCFGAVAPATISGRLAARNALLAAPAAAAAFAAGRADVQALPPLEVLVTVVVGTILLMGFEFVQVRRASRTRPAS